MIAAELRRAIVAAAAAGPDPLLRPGPEPGSYTSSLPFRLARRPTAAAAGRPPRPRALDRRRRPHRPRLPHCHRHPRRPGRLAIAHRPGRPGLRRKATRWPAAPCPAPRGGPGRADWPSARAALAAAADRPAGRRRRRHVIFCRTALVPAPRPLSRDPWPAVAYAGPDAVRFALARMPPGGRPPQPASSRGTCSTIPPMLFGTRMPPLPPCCAGPPRWGRQPGSSRACSWHHRSWRCSTRCPGSRNGWPWPRGAAGPTSSPGTWRSWQRGRLTP